MTAALAAKGLFAPAWLWDMEPRPWREFQAQRERWQKRTAGHDSLAALHPLTAAWLGKGAVEARAGKAA